VLFGADLDAMKEVGLTQNTDQLPMFVDDRQGADVMLSQQLDPSATPVSGCTVTSIACIMASSG
jgi:hypothetical protein